MCAIIGALLRHIGTNRIDAVNEILEGIWINSHDRGRDGRGVVINSSAESRLLSYRDTDKNDGHSTQFAPQLYSPALSTVIIGNLRAEPTTEFVAQKLPTDQQPYTDKRWSIVHNGTIANDKELRTGAIPTLIDSAAIVEQLAPLTPSLENFSNVVRKLKGSFAILATYTGMSDTLYVAANYRPIWYIDTPYGYFFASSRDYLPSEWTPRMLTPYTVARFTFDPTEGDEIVTESLYAPQLDETALVVCSGGLDSVVSAAYAQKELGMGVHLIHFLYGSRAEGPEVKAVEAVAKELNAELTLFPLNVYSKSDSPLLDPDSKVAGGEAGAEFAHEWVPARNLLLLSVATAFAEARGISTIVLGNNLEEAGAYPDNEPEFIARFNDLLPFAVGDGKQMRVIMPVGNLMKHEIVALGAQLGAPMHLTWSCYRAGELHCGTCGPCYMRRKAFEINNIPEVISYKDEQ